MLPLLFVLLFSSLATAKPVEIKIATVAPRGSIWTRIFQRFKARVHKLSKGQVKLRLYPGQVQGDERDVVRKMRTGQLDGGAFTAIGLAMINPEVLVMQMPGMFREYDKLDKAKLDRLRDLAGRFGHPKTDAACREWSREISAHERSRPVDAEIDFHLLPHRYEIFSTQKKPGSAA